MQRVASTSYCDVDKLVHQGTIDRIEAPTPLGFPYTHMSSFIGMQGVASLPRLQTHQFRVDLEMMDQGGECVRMFVSGERSGSGKSSTCCALLHALLQRGFAPSDLAYIKPATQCEEPQLIAAFCAQHGISCEGVGPVVFYKGFTRAFLSGELEDSPDSATLLRRVAAAVDKAGEGRRVVLVDGVGYAAVGSIVGVSNATVAKAARAPVLLVGKSGVGDAVDSFSLSACFFRAHGVPVKGVVFNKLPTEGYYSVDRCAAAVRRYFTRVRATPGIAGDAAHAVGSAASVYGFVPQCKELGEAQVTWSARSASAAAALSEVEAAQLRAFFDVFERSVDCDKLLADFGITWEQRAPSCTAAGAMTSAEGSSSRAPRAFNGVEWFAEKLRRKVANANVGSAKRKRTSVEQGGATTTPQMRAGAGVKRSRSEIEKAAAAQGATGG